MSNKRIKEIDWDTPNADEVYTVVRYLGGINAVCRIAKKHRNTVSKWCNGGIRIDFANWELIKEYNIASNDKKVSDEYIKEMDLIEKIK